MIRRILVWDAPTRVFHWLQVLSFGFAYLTDDSERMRNYHVALGYILLGLLVFRLLWGFIGTRYARFNSFLFNPKEIFSYLFDAAQEQAGAFPGAQPRRKRGSLAAVGAGVVYLRDRGVVASGRRQRSRG